MLAFNRDQLYFIMMATATLELEVPKSIPQDKTVIGKLLKAASVRQ
jgi:hypothetical protein